MAKAYKRLRRQRTQRRLKNQSFMEPSKRPLQVPSRGGGRNRSFALCSRALDSLFGTDLKKPTPRNDMPAFDAANVLRFGQDLIYLVSATGNELGGVGYSRFWAKNSESTY
jgi:hypothetical protein